MFKKLKEKLSNTFKTFPRSDTIPFPEVSELKLNMHKLRDINLELLNEYNRPSDPMCLPYDANFFLLKSGNILMSYHRRIRERNTDLYNFLEIYSIPDLKLVQKYEFPTPDEGPLYYITNAIKL